MSKFLNSLDKKPYQTYAVEHGIERFKISVPLAEAKSFEAAFAQAIKDGDASKDSLLKVVSSFNGKLTLATK